MNTMTNQKPRMIRLQCGHELWFLPKHTPEPRSDLWCPKCSRYTVAEVTPRCASIEGDWQWTPLGETEYFVECLRPLPNGERCPHSFRTKRGWYHAESEMDRHLKRPPHASGRFTSNLKIERVSYADDSPPF